MIKKLKLMILSFSYALILAIGGGTAAMLGTGSAYALDCGNPQTAAEREQCGACLTDPSSCNSNPSDDVSHVIRNIINVISILAGAVAVVMIVYAGFRYVTSGGNAQTVKAARDIILYAIVGLVVIALAQVIVHFTLTSVSSS